VPLFIDAVSTSEKLGVNRHITQCIRPIPFPWSCRANWCEGYRNWAALIWSQCADWPCERSYMGRRTVTYPHSQPSQSDSGEVMSRDMMDNNYIVYLHGILWSGLELPGRGGLWNPQWGLHPPTPSSCLQTLIFEWKSALNFNPWANFQTFRQFQHWLWLCVTVDCAFR